MFETSVYKNRRARLKEKVKSGLVLILGNGEAPANYTDNTYKLRMYDITNVRNANLRRSVPVYHLLYRREIR